MDGNVKEYNYKRFRVNKDGEVKEYTQKQTHLIVESSNKNDTKSYIHDMIKFASKKALEINRIEKILKTVLRYRGYNEKNLFQRIHRLENANEITLEEKTILRKIMDRQKTIAGDLADILNYILMLYEVQDEEVKDIKNQLQEYAEK